MPQAPLHQPTPRGSGPPLSVLILDDERFDRHRLARMCSGLVFPCEVTAAKSLADFSDSLQEQIFGLILIDYMLPDGTGLDALDMVRLCARNLNAPTLMITGKMEEGLSTRAKSAGCSGYLQKDTLTKAMFSQAVMDALGTFMSALPATKTSFDRDEITALLRQLMLRDARDIKPMVSRMLRQLRGMRSGNLDDEKAMRAAIEQNCMSLWVFLQEMERRDGTEILEDLCTGQNPDEVPSAKLTFSRKPPSPFSKFRH